MDISLQFPSQDAVEVEGEDLRLPPLILPLFLFPDSDSAVELWEPDAQDANSRALRGSSCILREEASMPQSAGGTSGAGLEVADPTALLPGVQVLPESTGEELLDLEDVGAPRIWKGHLGALYHIKSCLSTRALVSTRPE